MSSLETVSFIASIASLVLAVVAISLSIVFYQMSSKLSESTREAAKGIGASVDRLEKLFDKLYADTFAMMRDTVSDMRKHIWPDDVHLDEKVLEEAEAKADEKVNALKDDFQKQLSRVLEGQEHTDARLKGVASEIGKLVDKAISQSRKLEIEARAETLREHVINVIRNLSQRRGVAKADEIVDRLEDRFRSIAVIEELRRMKADGVIMYDGDLVPDRPITLR